MFSAMRSSPCRQALVRAALRAALAASSLAAPLEASAAALGDAHVRSFLGQRLDADIEFAALSAAEADNLVVRIAPADLFAEAGIDVTAVVRSVRVAVDRRSGRSLIRVTSDLPVNDPFVTLLIEVSTNGSRLVRQYALLIDPPAVETPAEQAAGALVPAAGAAERASTAVVGAPDAASTPPPAPPRPTRTTLTVRRGQAMAGIAATVQPEGVQLEQVLVALHKANPDAFADGNINRVRSGSVLRVPEPDAMRVIDPAEARRILRVQTADFLRYQKTMAERAGPPPAAPSATPEVTAPGNRSSSGQIGVQIAEPRSPASAQDKLTLSAPGGTDVTGASMNTTEVLDKIAAERALADANARIAALEKGIADMQQLLALQNKGLAEAQQRATQPVPPEPDRASGDRIPDPQPETPAAPVAELASPAATAPTAEPVQGAASPSPSPAPADTDSGLALLDDPRLQAGLAGVLLLPLLGWGLWRRRRRSSGALAPSSDTTLSQTVIADAGGRHVDTAHSAFHSNFVPSVSQIDANEVDAVAEADVYIAYGRDAQAEEILLDALRAHPDRHTLRLKLLEIYAAREDKLKFVTLAAELRVLTHGQGDEWLQASRLGQMFDPGNRLFSARARSDMSPAPPGGAPHVPAMVSPVADFSLKLEGLLDERRAEQGLPSVPTSMSEPAAPGPVEFSLSGIASPSPAAAPGHTGSPPDRRPDTAALTTKLDLAIACQEIGDTEGARELLSEVAAAHDPELSPRAQSLLRQLA